MGLLLIFFWSRTLLRRDNSWFGGFNSRLSGLNSRSGRLREFSVKRLILHTGFRAESALTGKNRKNSRFHGKNRELSKLHDLPPQAFCDGFGARLGVEFAEQRFQVELHSMRRDAELPGGGFVAEPPADRGEYLDFARRQWDRRFLGH